MDALDIDKAAKDATSAIATVDIPAFEAAANRLLGRIFSTLGAVFEAMAGAFTSAANPK